MSYREEELERQVGDLEYDLRSCEKRADDLVEQNNRLENEIQRLKLDLESCEEGRWEGG
jgi:regulator of replication initiation timing